MDSAIKILLLLALLPFAGIGVAVMYQGLRAAWLKIRKRKGTHGPA